MMSSGIETSAHVEIDGQRFLLDRARDLVDLMGQIETAARTEPTFVHLSEGHDLVSVLVSAQSRIVVTVERESRAQAADCQPIVPSIDWDL